MIATGLPKLRDTEEVDGVVAASALPSLLPYNTRTTTDYCGLTNNLLSFQLAPTNPNNTPALLMVALLIHMSTYRNHNMEGDKAAGVPTDAIDVHIGELQMECIQPTNVDIRKRQILADAGVQGEKMKVVMRKLDSLGYIQGRCSFLTDTDRIIRVRHHLELADPISEVKWIKDAA